MQVIEMTKQIVRPKRMDEQGNEKPLTWDDIKQFANTLTNEQLQQPAFVWGDEKSGHIFSIAETQDDLINPSGEGVEPKSLYAQSDDDFVKAITENEPIVLSKGRIILELDF